MRIIFILFLILPLAAFSQVNRSANELAREKAEEYITGKLFTGKTYAPVWYGLLKECGDKWKEIRWRVDHDFRISSPPDNDKKEQAVQGQLYRFTFYFNERMKVIKAESYSRTGSG